MDTINRNVPPSTVRKAMLSWQKKVTKSRQLGLGSKEQAPQGKPKAGESDRMKKKRASFKARHAKNIAKGKMSAAYWANKVKW